MKKYVKNKQKRIFFRMKKRILSWRQSNQQQHTQTNKEERDDEKYEEEQTHTQVCLIL
jgi:hypothetical protein